LNWPHIIVLLILKPITFCLGEYGHRRCGQFPGFSWHGKVELGLRWCGRWEGCLSASAWCVGGNNVPRAGWRVHAHCANMMHTVSTDAGSAWYSDTSGRSGEQQDCKVQCNWCWTLLDPVRNWDTNLGRMWELCQGALSSRTKWVALKAWGS